MKLYFLRHAEAGEHDPSQYPDDSKRPLSPEGIQDMKASAQAMKNAGIAFDRAFSSPYVRARQTAEITLDVLGGPRIEFTDALVPDASFHDFFKLIESVPAQQRLLFTGHDPSISHFVATLVSPIHTRSLKKGGLAVVEFSVEGKKGFLEHFLAPKDMRNLS